MVHIATAITMFSSRNVGIHRVPAGIFRVNCLIL